MGWRIYAWFPGVNLIFIIRVSFSRRFREAIFYILSCFLQPCLISRICAFKALIWAFWEPCRGFPMPSYACSILLVKQPVNAASGSLPSICLCQIWEDGSSHYSRECQQVERPLSQLGIPDIEQASNDAELGQQLPPQGGKKQGVKGGATPPCKIWR